MIPQPHINQWSIDHPWPSTEQVEQDLLLAQAICEISRDNFLGSELVLRGGTAFHKLFLPHPYRYSEDLDYVRNTAGGIGNVMHGLTDMGRRLGYEVRTQMSQHPKVFWRYKSSSGIRRKIKIEINTFERSPMLPLVRKQITVTNGWCAYQVPVNTFQVEELVATKIRALYQRSKGRDLFDIWLALTVLELNPKDVIGAFPAYRPAGLTVKDLRSNLEKKLADYDFCHDCDALIAGGTKACGYEARAAGELVDRVLFARL